MNEAKHDEKGEDEDFLLVIGAGHGRTGTMSMKEAMSILGFGPCYHMIENLQKGHSELWVRLGTLPPGHPDRPPWSPVFKGYRSTMDLPGFLFYQELMDLNPNAKVILTVRDPEKWYVSVADTIRNSVPESCQFRGMRFLMTVLWNNPTLKMLTCLVGEKFHQGYNSKESWVRNFNRHNEEVQRVVPREKLLVYQVSEGWEPLCKFLGLPIPDVPFPHLNDTNEYRRMLHMANIIGYVLGATIVGLVLLLVYLVYHFIQ